MEERNLRKVLIGTVVSNKMDKTIVVAVETSEKHKKYGKFVKKTYKLKMEQIELPKFHETFNPILDILSNGQVINHRDNH